MTINLTVSHTNIKPKILRWYSLKDKMTYSRLLKKYSAIEEGVGEKHLSTSIFLVCHRRRLRRREQETVNPPLLAFQSLKKEQKKESNRECSSFSKTQAGVSKSVVWM